MNTFKGFTLVELMIVVMIVALLAVIVMPSYQRYTLRNNESLAEARMLELSQDLEQHKSRNFSYRRFTPTSVIVGNPEKYTITLVALDGTGTVSNLTTVGVGWAMKATPNDARNYTYLFNSQGLKCRNKLASSVTYLTCGVDSETW